MADNYIERQYEQYEARKAAWEKARKYGKKKTGITHPARTEQPGQTTTEPHHYKYSVKVGIGWHFATKTK